MGSELVLIARILVYMRRGQNGVTLNLSRHGNRTTNLCARPLRRINNFLSGLVDQPMVKGFKPDSDALALHRTNISRIVKELPAKQPWNAALEG